MVDQFDTPSSPTPAPASSASSVGSAMDAGFFERERSRLIQDISKGVESILGNSNVLNRKIEESISVGKEFHPISELWSKFEKIMLASGIPNLYPHNQNSSSTIVNPSDSTHLEKIEDDKQFIDSPAPTAALTPRRKSSSTRKPDEMGTDAPASERIRFETAQSSLPPGVAPGGGRIYA